MASLHFPQKAGSTFARMGLHSSRGSHAFIAMAQVDSSHLTAQLGVSVFLASERVPTAPTTTAAQRINVFMDTIIIIVVVVVGFVFLRLLLKDPFGRCEQEVRNRRMIINNQTTAEIISQTHEHTNTKSPLEIYTREKDKKNKNKKKKDLVRSINRLNSPPPRHG